MAAFGGNILADFAIFVTANTTQATAAMAALSGELTGFAGIATAMSSIGKMMTIGVTLPIMAIGAAAVYSANEIQGFYQTLQAGAVGGSLSMDQLKDSFNTLYSEFPQGGTVIANTLLNVSNVMGETFGNNQKQIQDFAQSFLQLSMVTGEDANKMSAAVTKAFNQWGVSAQDAQKDLQFLWQAAEQARTSVTSLGDQVGQYSQIMQGAGFNIQDTTAAIAQMDQNGMDLSKTVTGMAYGMASLSAGGKAVAPVLATISKEEGGLDTATMSTHQMWDGLVKGITDGSITMGDATSIFGKRYATNIYEAIKNGHLSFDQFEKDAEGMKTSMDEAAKKSMTFSQRLTVLRHDVELALQPLGITIIDVLEGFMPVITFVLSAVREMLIVFNQLPTPIKDVVIIFALILAAIGPVLWIAGSLITAFISVAGAVTTILPLLGEFALELGILDIEIIPLLATFLLIAIAVAAIAVLGYVLYNNYAPFKTLVDDIWQRLQEIAGLAPQTPLEVKQADQQKEIEAKAQKEGRGVRATDITAEGNVEELGPNESIGSHAAGRIAEWAGQNLHLPSWSEATKGGLLDPAAWAGPVNTITSGLNTIKVAFQNFGGAVVNALQPVINVFMVVGHAVETFGRMVLLVFVIIAYAIYNFAVGVYNALAALWNALVNAVGPPLNAMKITIQQGLNTIKQFFVDTWNSLVNIVGPPLNSMKITIQEGLNTIKQFFIDIWNGIVNFFGGIWDSLNTKASEGANTVQTTAEGPFNTLSTDLQNIWNGIVTAAQNAMNGLANWFANLVIPMPHIPDVAGALRGAAAAAGVPESVTNAILPAADEGGLFTEPTVAVLAANRRPELVIPLDNIKRGPLTGAAVSTGSGGANVSASPIIVQFNHPVITSKKEAEALSYEVAYGARAQLRRAGYST
jgi:phage-related minor tail protein